MDQISRCGCRFSPVSRWRHVGLSSYSTDARGYCANRAIAAAVVAQHHEETEHVASFSGSRQSVPAKPGGGSFHSKPGGWPFQTGTGVGLGPPRRPTRTAGGSRKQACPVPRLDLADGPDVTHCAYPDLPGIPANSRSSSLLHPAAYTVVWPRLKRVRGIAARRRGIRRRRSHHLRTLDNICLRSIRARARRSRCCRSRYEALWDTWAQTFWAASVRSLALISWGMAASASN